MLELGASIIITSRKMDVLEKTAKEFNEKYPDKTFPIAGDVRNIEDVENVINLGYKHFGTINCLLNNAAGNFISPTERLSSKGFDVIIDSSGRTLEDSQKVIANVGLPKYRFLYF